MYDLHNLGWHGFQQLCLTVTREILGQTVESFLDSSDAGRDGAFAGTWAPSPTEQLSGRFVIQCKFTSIRDKTLTSSDLRDDVKKAKKLVQRGRCDCYILMTNAGISGSTAEAIETNFVDAGAKQVRLFGSTWISQQIRENKRLRMLVPRIYGLGDLSQILDDRAYTQARALLASLREDLSKVVLTSAYRRAAEALDQHGFVLLIGEPAAGKTTIASMLSIGALDQWGASTLKLDDAPKAVERWNPDEPSQFFWIDDAFGVLQYEPFLVHGWNHALPKINTMLRTGAKIVMTSRDYIYRQARNDLKESAFPLLRESQVVIDVRDLTLDEKQQILYNHLKLGKQDKAFRSAIKPHLPAVASNTRFVPETARRLSDPLFTARLGISNYALNIFVEKQADLLLDVLRGLDQHSKAALALIYMSNGELESPITLQESEREAVERLGSTLGKCITALDALDGSLVQYTHTEQAAGWRFKHPTVGDAYADLLLQSPELLSVYVSGSPAESLMGQVTCGNVGLGRTVALPKGLFPLVLKRLDEPFSTRAYKSPALSSWEIHHRVYNFLATRCSKEFLAQYINAHPDVLKRVSTPGLYLNSVSEVGLAIRFHEFGLLPEEYRRSFVAKVVSYAIGGDDFAAIDSRRIQSVFTTEELIAFRENLLSGLIPYLSDITSRRMDEYSGGRSADDHMHQLLEGLETLQQEFADSPEILDDINVEIKSIQDWVQERTPDAPDAEAPDGERPARVFGDVDVDDHLPVQTRGIFDDVDE